MHCGRLRHASDRRQKGNEKTSKHNNEPLRRRLLVVFVSGRGRRQKTNRVQYNTT